MKLYEFSKWKKQKIISYDINYFLISTSTLFKTETRQVEHSHFFYPKKINEEFIITLAFQNKKKTLVLNKDSLSIENEFNLTFKNIVVK